MSIVILFCCMGTGVFHLYIAQLITFPSSSLIFWTKQFDASVTVGDLFLHTFLAVKAEMWLQDLSWPRRTWLMTDSLPPLQSWVYFLPVTLLCFLTLTFQDPIHHCHHTAFSLFWFSSSSDFLLHFVSPPLFWGSCTKSLTFVDSKFPSMPAY